MRAARRLLVTAAAASCAVSAAPAAAHTHLADLRPEPEATLVSPPAAVALRFSEPVDVVGRAAVIRSAGRGVALDVLRRRGGRLLLLRPRAPLAAGRVDVRFRVLSRDGHVLRGRYGFRVRRGTSAAAAATAGTSQALRLGGGGRGGADTAVAIAHGIHHLLFVLVAGLVLAGPRVLPAAGVRWPIGALRALCAAAAVTALLCASLTWLAAGDASWTRAVLPATVADAAGTTAGAEWLLRAGLWALAAVVAGGVLRGRPVVLTAVLGGLALSLALGGHAGSHGGAGSIAVDTVHVLAAGAWLGGLAVLALAARRGDRAAATTAFAPGARLAFAVLLATGVLNGLLRLGGVTALGDGDYGALVAVKLGLAAAIAAVAALAARRRPATGVTAAQLTVELTLGAAALAAAAILVETAPPT